MTGYCPLCGEPAGEITLFARNVFPCGHAVSFPVDFLNIAGQSLFCYRCGKKIGVFPQKKTAGLL